MKKQFLGDWFLLQNETAHFLYYEHAQNCPIIDFHCHLPSKDIAENRQFNDLSDIWLEGDHYKWRAMRANGIHEKYITGNAPNYEKFKAWAATVPFTLRNPLYHWTHLELRRYFHIQELLSSETADKIYRLANEMIGTPEFRAQSLIRKMNVELICTSDDPVDDLKYHRQIQANGLQGKIFPTWRPDNLMTTDDPDEFKIYIDQLERSANLSITTYDDLLQAIDQRHQFFHDSGCRLADHGLYRFFSPDFTHSQVSSIFQKMRSGMAVSQEQTMTYQSAMIYDLSLLNHKRGWAQQFHSGAIRNTNPRFERELGPNTGFDSIGSSQDAEPISKFLGKLDESDQLAPTVLYNNNPADNYMYAAMAGNFQDGSIPAKLQYGPAWWFLDQKEGIEMHINALSYLGLLSRFVGMVTDSRSFLSYPRHEYFRRILCNILGREIEEGLLPDDLELIGNMVEDICYRNAKDYFKFNDS